MTVVVSPVVTRLALAHGVAVFRGLNDPEIVLWRQGKLVIRPKQPAALSVLSEFASVRDPRSVHYHVLELRRGRAVSLSLDPQVAIFYAVHDHHGEPKREGVVATMSFPHSEPSYVGGTEPAFWRSGAHMFVDPRHLFAGNFEAMQEAQNRSVADQEILLAAGAMPALRVGVVPFSAWDGKTKPWKCW